MAFDEQLAERIRAILKRKRGISERKMFGGLCFMVDDKMSVGVLKTDLVVRISPETAAELLKQPNVRMMDFTGKPMRGMLYVGPPAVKSEAELKEWVELSVAYARSLPEKKPKRR